MRRTTPKAQIQSVRICFWYQEKSPSCLQQTGTV